MAVEPTEQPSGGPPDVTRRRPTPRRRPRTRGFGRRVFLTAVVVTGLLSAFGLWSLRHNESQNRLEARRNVERTAILAGALAQSLVDSGLRTLQVAAVDSSFTRADPAAMDAYLQSSRGVLGAFNGGLFWVDATGVPRAQVTPDNSPLTPVNVSDRQYFRDAMAGKATISPALTSKVVQRRVVIFAVPTHGRDGAVNGVLAASFWLTEVPPAVLKQLFGTASLSVLDREGNLVFGQPIAIRDRSALDRTKGKGSGTLSALPRSDGGYEVISYSRVTGAADWLVVVERNESELYRTISEQSVASIELLVMLATVSLLAAAWVGWRLDRSHRDIVQERTLLDTILEQLPVAAVVADRSGSTLVNNRQAEMSLGGRDPLEMLPPLADALVNGESVSRLELDTPGDDGGEGRRFVVSAAPVLSAGKVRAATAVFEDITVQHRLASEAEALGAVTASLASVDDPTRIARLVVDPGAVGMGASSGVVLTMDRVEPDHVTVAAATGSPSAREAWMVGSSTAAHPALDAARNDRAVILTADELERRYPEWAPTFAASGEQAWAALPLQSAGHVVAVLGLGFTSVDAVAGANIPKLVGFAAQAGQALTRAERRRVEHDAALVLQRSLLDPVERANADVQFACRYLPSSDHMEVGGDFFDVIATESGSTLFVIGDVVGHGLAAASAMSQIRSAVRALVAITDDPATLLTLLDRFVSIVPDCRVATAALVRVDLDRGQVVHSLAGHPPPQMRLGDGTVVDLGGEPDPPLGVARRPRRQHTVALPPGPCALVMYTDGLVERRGEPIDLRIGRVERLLRSAERHDAERLAESILSAVADEERQRDDIALMCVSFEITPRAGGGGDDDRTRGAAERSEPDPGTSGTTPTITTVVAERSRS